MFIPMPVLVGIGAVVLLLLALLGRGLRRGGADPLLDARADPALRGAVDLPTVPAELEDRLRALLARRDKIGAIKVLREATGMGLKDAKDLIERL